MLEIGRPINHDDTIGESTLAKGFTETCSAWFSTYHEQYVTNWVSREPPQDTYASCLTVVGPCSPASCTAASTGTNSCGSCGTGTSSSGYGGSSAGAGGSASTGCGTSSGSGGGSGGGTGLQVVVREPLEGVVLAGVVAVDAVAGEVDEEGTIYLGRQD